MNENCVCIGYRIYRNGFQKSQAIFGQGTDRGTIIEEAVNATKNDDTTEVHFIYEDIIKKKGRS